MIRKIVLHICNTTTTTVGTLLMEKHLLRGESRNLTNQFLKMEIHQSRFIPPYPLARRADTNKGSGIMTSRQEMPDFLTKIIPSMFARHCAPPGARTYGNGQGKKGILNIIAYKRVRTVEHLH